MRLRKEEIACEATPFKAVQHRSADRVHPPSTRSLVEALRKQAVIDQKLGRYLIEVGK